MATDYEEITTIEGGKAYVADLQKLAAAQGFSIVAAIDGELSGWNCWAEGLCGGNPPAPRSTFTLAASTCNGNYDSSALGAAMTAVATTYSPMTVDVECDDDTDGSELYNFWKVGVPAFYFEEYGNDNNPYFDDGGDDTMAHLDATYLHQIARVAAVFVANLAGLP